MELGPVEIRVAACLAEKQLTTPQQYPLTLNALVAACNQTSNREPVTHYDDYTVEGALDSLKTKGLVRFVHPSHGRSVTRYRHVLDEVLDLGTRHLALLTALMLRGPQTPGQLRAHTERMADFSDADEVESGLSALAGDQPPLVATLPREPGRREVRYVHLLAAADGRGDGDGDGDGNIEEPVAPTAENSDAEPDFEPPKSPDRDRAPIPIDVTQEIMALKAEVAAIGRALDHILARLSK